MCTTHTRVQQNVCGSKLRAQGSTLESRAHLHCDGRGGVVARDHRGTCAQKSAKTQNEHGQLLVCLQGPKSNQNITTRRMRTQSQHIWAPPTRRASLHRRFNSSVGRVPTLAVVVPVAADARPDVPESEPGQNNTEEKAKINERHGEDETRF